MRIVLTSKWAKAVVFVLCLMPLASLVWRGLHNDLTANPVQFITNTTGDWTLRLLLVTLVVTPLRKIVGLPELIRFRRMIGLFAFFYGCLHLITYMWLDKFFDLAEMWKDVSKRPYITIGSLAFILMIPLAVTSTAGWIRRMGGRRWQLLHRAIYISAIAGVIHYYWLVKAAVIRPLTYGAIVAVLLLWRLADQFRRRPGALANPAVKSQPQKLQA